MRVREQAFTAIRNVFKRHGAVEIDTPVFELKEVRMYDTQSLSEEEISWVSFNVFFSHFFSLFLLLMCFVLLRRSVDTVSPCTIYDAEGYRYNRCSPCVFWGCGFRRGDVVGIAGAAVAGASIPNLPRVNMTGYSFERY